MSIGDLVVGNLDAAKGGEISAGAEFFADVFGKSADVGAT